MMQTKIWDIQSHELNNEAAHVSLDEIAYALKSGEVIGMPTETVYGLAADAGNDDAIKKVFQAKGRPSDNPLIVHIHDVSQLDDITTHVDDKVRLLMQRFWPGALSFILPLKPGALSRYATAGLETVAIRMPSHPVARAVLRHAGIPIAAPSANTSGKPSPTEARHVMHDLNGKIFGIINSESSVVGLESTVIDCTIYPYRIVRPGAVTQRDLETVLQEHVSIEASDNVVPISPGMKYTHYAPHQPIQVVENWNIIDTLLEEESRVVGVIAPETIQDKIHRNMLFIPLCKDTSSYKEAGRNLYRALREMDTSHVEVIYIHGFSQNEESAALNDRIYRAAGKGIVEG